MYYDLITIGAGPAGLTAAIYASCFKLRHLVIGKDLGGQIMLAPEILNYPGFEEISGPDLAMQMIAHAQKRGAEIVIDSVISIKKQNDIFELSTQNGKTYQTKTIILATGVERKKLNIPGEIEYTGKGIQYCATCERFDYQNKVTAVIGGANAAAQTAIQLSHAASKVYIVYRGDELRADPIWNSYIKEIPNIEILYNTVPVEVLGNGNIVTGIKIKSIPQNSFDTKELLVDRIFIEIGGVPGTALLIPLGVKVDPGGYIEVDETLQTSVGGIFAAGDVLSRKFSIEQISSAVGFGAHAAVSVFSYLKQQKAPSLWGANQIRSNVQ